MNKLVVSYREELTMIFECIEIVDLRKLCISSNTIHMWYRGNWLVYSPVTDSTDFVFLLVLYLDNSEWKLCEKR
jgi:hypothetical protein